MVYCHKVNRKEAIEMAKKVDLTKQKSCPFCGSHELNGWEKGGAINAYFIECQNCITLFKFPDHVQFSALELWNDRGHVANPLSLGLRKIQEGIQEINNILLGGKNGTK